MRVFMLLITKIESLFIAAKDLLPTLQSDYVTEQLMLAELNFYWSHIFMWTGIVSIPFILLVWFFRGCLQKAMQESFIALSWIVLLVSLVLFPVLHAAAGHHSIKAASPALQLVKSGIQLLF